MRVDVYLSQHGYVASRTRAQQLIAKGLITMDGRVLVRPSEDVDESVSHAVEIVEDIFTN